MFWLCTNAVINWNAIAAIGTACAALIALVVWLTGIAIRLSERRASSKLLATLLITETERIARKLQNEILYFEGETTADQSKRKIAARGSISRLNSKYHADIAAYFSDKADALNPIGLERRIDKIDVLPAKANRAITALLRKIIALHDFASATVPKEYQLRKASIESFYNQLVEAKEISAVAISILYKISKIDRKVGDGTPGGHC